METCVFTEKALFEAWLRQIAERRFHVPTHFTRAHSTLSPLTQFHTSMLPLC